MNPLENHVQINNQVNEQVQTHEQLEQIFKTIAKYLPIQAPILRFIQLNSLQNFEDMPFEEAVVMANEVFGADTYVEEDVYEKAIQEGRIQHEDMHASFDEKLQNRPIFQSNLFLKNQNYTLKDFYFSRLFSPIPHLKGESVLWHLEEYGELKNFQRKLPKEIQIALLEEYQIIKRKIKNEPKYISLKADMDSGDSYLYEDIQFLLNLLWQKVLKISQNYVKELKVKYSRVKDYLLKKSNENSDLLVNAEIIRFVSSFLDQGISNWSMINRELGMWRSFLEYQKTTAFHAPWMTHVTEDVLEILKSGRSAEDHIVYELNLLEVPQTEWQSFLLDTLLTLPGWAGMIHQMQTRPDLMPQKVFPAHIKDYLAIRLLFERHANTWLAKDQNIHDSLPEMLQKAKALSKPKKDVYVFAYELFVMAQRNALGPVSLDQDEIVTEFINEMKAMDSTRRRLLYHLAYERRLGLRALEVMRLRVQNRVEVTQPCIAQAVFCMDEREESYRRHLEEVEPRIATYGYAGNFDVLMSYYGYDAPKPIPLCPPVAKPRHRIREVPISDDPKNIDLLKRKHSIGHLEHLRLSASQHVLGGVFYSLSGLVEAFPLLGKTLMPDRLSILSRKLEERLAPKVKTRLAITRSDDIKDPSLGVEDTKLFDGYTYQEQANSVEQLLKTIGLIKDFAPLILIAGHGSTTANNPLMSAYQCGACSGGKGGPNARAFAQMANHPKVREILKERNIHIPETTYFIGAYHDTASNEMTYLDIDLLPESYQAQFKHLSDVVYKANILDAQERCRRFPDVSLNITPEEAIKEVYKRSVDIGQSRPEYCASTNAFAIIGRRSITRSVFLDRRAFLFSYDAHIDGPEAKILERILSIVGPVGSGINLQYYFSRVDQQYYGAGSKLPHNITGMLGVMNGHGGDLRTGLHWQGVDIHEPVRLLVVIEATPQVLEEIVNRNAVVRKLVVNRWILVASVHPDTNEIQYFTPRGFEPLSPSNEAVHLINDAYSHYNNKVENLPFGLLKPFPDIKKHPEVVWIQPTYFKNRSLQEKKQGIK